MSMTQEKQTGLTPKQWAAIEADYRAGIRPLRQIASEHGITEGAIRKRAKKEDWQRDLSAKIQAKAETLVREEAVRDEVRTAHRVPESVVVSENAEMVAGVMLSHRTDIRRNRGIAMKLLAELEGQCDNPDILEQLADEFAGPPLGGDGPDDKAAEARRRRLLETFEKVTSLPSRVDSMKKLADTLKVLVALEREAYNIGVDDDKNTGNYEDFLDKL